MHDQPFRTTLRLILLSWHVLIVMSGLLEFASNSVLERAGSGLVLSSWELVEERVIERGELRAPELIHVRTKLVECPAEDRTKRTERRSSSAGHGGERSLVEEASAVVSWSLSQRESPGWRLEQADGVMVETEKAEHWKIGEQGNSPSSKDAPLKTPPVKSPVSTPVKLSGDKLVGRLDIEVCWTKSRKNKRTYLSFLCCLRYGQCQGKLHCWHQGPRIPRG